MPTVLVTGGCGFIGSHLVSELRARGERVRVLDLAQPCDRPWGIEFLHGSILDRGLLARAMAGVHCAYHLAGIAHLWTHDRTELDLVNGTRNGDGAAGGRCAAG